MAHSDFDDHIRAYEVHDGFGRGRLYVAPHADDCWRVWVEHELRPGKTVSIVDHMSPMQARGLVAFLDEAFNQIQRAANHHRRRD